MPDADLVHAHDPSQLRFRDTVARRTRVGRLVWTLVWKVLFRPSPVFTPGWRRMLLRLFGARISPSANIYSSARIWAPWNLTMEDHSCLARDVDCYSAAPIVIGSRATVSQYAFLCTASHDISDPGFPMIQSPITIGAGAWICARAFIGPGVVVGPGAVVAACAVVVKAVEPWTVVGGNPARVIKTRSLS